MNICAVQNDELLVFGIYGRACRRCDVKHRLIGYVCYGAGACVFFATDDTPRRRRRSFFRIPVIKPAATILVFRREGVI